MFSEFFFGENVIGIMIGTQQQSDHAVRRVAPVDGARSVTRARSASQGDRGFLISNVFSAPHGSHASRST